MLVDRDEVRQCVSAVTESKLIARRGPVYHKVERLVRSAKARRLHLSDLQTLFVLLHSSMRLLAMLRMAT